MWLFNFWLIIFLLDLLLTILDALIFGLPYGHWTAQSSVQFLHAVIDRIVTANLPHIPSDSDCPIQSNCSIERAITTSIIAALRDLSIFAEIIVHQVETRIPSIPKLLLLKHSLLKLGL